MDREEVSPVRREYVPVGSAFAFPANEARRNLFPVHAHASKWNFAVEARVRSGFANVWGCVCLWRLSQSASDA